MIGARLSIVVVIALLVLVAGAQAAGNDKSGPTVGDCMSDGLYGNEPNMADGSLGGPAEQEPGTQGRQRRPDAVAWALGEQPGRPGEPNTWQLCRSVESGRLQHPGGLPRRGQPLSGTSERLGHYWATAYEVETLSRTTKPPRLRGFL